MQGHTGNAKGCGHGWANPNVHQLNHVHIVRIVERLLQLLSLDMTKRVSHTQLKPTNAAIVFVLAIRHGDEWPRSAWMCRACQRYASRTNPPTKGSRATVNLTQSVRCTSGGNLNQKAHKHNDKVGWGEGGRREGDSIPNQSGTTIRTCGGWWSVSHGAVKSRSSSAHAG